MHNAIAMIMTNHNTSVTVRCQSQSQSQSQMPKVEAKSKSKAKAKAKAKCKMHKCTNAQMHKCTNAQMPNYQTANCHLSATSTHHQEQFCGEHDYTVVQKRERNPNNPQHRGGFAHYRAFEEVLAIPVFQTVLVKVTRVHRRVQTAALRVWNAVYFECPE